ncbi:MAG: HDOD domain-containing protein [Betaproteobacteria bacterium]|nr:HDOD domain-containing protein [Betaproteobacteria bacterium]
MDMNDLVQALGQKETPVLASTAEAMSALRRDEDKISARDISRVVLRDPLMTLRVLRFAEAKRGAKQLADITTVEHAVMMHGITTFMRAHAQTTPLEVSLAKDRLALDGALRVISRAQHASAFARAIAFQRHDIESDEVIISALLHDLAELLLWCHMPREESEIRYIVDNARGVRSTSAQRLILGFTHTDLQLALARMWNLPELLCRLMDDDHADHPRVINVVTAAALARHLDHGWNDPALPDDYARVQKMCGMSLDASQRLVTSAALTAARHWRSTRIVPVATWLPLEQGSVPPVNLGMKPPEAIDLNALKRGLHVLQHAPASLDEDVLVAWTLYCLKFGLGLHRVMYAAVSPGGKNLSVRFVLDGEIGAVSRLESMPMPLGGTDFFPRLMTKPQGIWAGGGNRAKIAGLLLPEQRAALGEGEFLLMSVFAGTSPKGLVYADFNGQHRPIPDSLYAPFKALCLTLSQRLSAQAAA